MAEKPVKTLTVKPYVLDENITFHPIIDICCKLRATLSFKKPEREGVHRVKLHNKTHIDWLIGFSWPHIGSLKDENKRFLQQEQ